MKLYSGLLMITCAFVVAGNEIDAIYSKLPSD